jgi:hypothetical protein
MISTVSKMIFAIFSYYKSIHEANYHITTLKAENFL